MLIITPRSFLCPGLLKNKGDVCSRHFPWRHRSSSRENSSPSHALYQTFRSFTRTIEFSDSVFTQDESIAKVAQPVRLFVLRGGHEMQLNTVNRDRFPDAKKHPENYRSLIVRVWGWSGIRQAA